eukprot:530787-Amphidinium_carterae.1
MPLATDCLQLLIARNPKNGALSDQTHQGVYTASTDSLPFMTDAYSAYTLMPCHVSCKNSFATGSAQTHQLDCVHQHIMTNANMSSPFPMEVANTPLVHSKNLSFKTYIAY